MINTPKNIYLQIQKDLQIIEIQLEKREGSKLLFERLRAKYSILIPEITTNIRIGGKMGFRGEFDFRPELIQIREILLSHLLLHPPVENLNQEVSNQSSELLDKTLNTGEDQTIDKIIEHSKILIRSKSSIDKQTALEKIWDAFERLKTLYGEGSKKSTVKTLITQTSHNSIQNQQLLENEFFELTKIGNTYEIRHFEKGKEPIPSDEFREYLYFRTLSIISYCMLTIK